MKSFFKKLLVQVSLVAILVSAALPVSVVSAAVTSDGSAIVKIAVDKSFVPGASMKVALTDSKGAVAYQIPVGWKLDLRYKGDDGENTVMASSDFSSFKLGVDEAYTFTPGVRGYNDGDYVLELSDKLGVQKLTANFEIADGLPARIALPKTNPVAGQSFDIGLMKEVSDDLVNLYSVYDVKLVDSKGATVASVKEFTGDVTNASTGVYRFNVAKAGTYTVKLIDQFLKELDSKTVTVGAAGVVVPDVVIPDVVVPPAVVSNDPVEFRLNHADLIYSQRELVSFTFLNALGNSTSLPTGWYLKFIQRDGTSFNVDTRLGSLRAPFHHGSAGTESTGIELYDSANELVYAGRLHVLKPANAGGVPVRFAFNAAAFAPGELVQITLYDAEGKVVKRPNSWNFVFNMLSAAGVSVGNGSLEGSLNSDLSFRAMDRTDVTVEVDLENSNDVLVDSQNFKILVKSGVDAYLRSVAAAGAAEAEGLAREGEAVNVKLKSDSYRAGEKVSFDFIDAEGDKITTGWPAGYSVRLFFDPAGEPMEFNLHPLVINSLSFIAPSGKGDYRLFVDKNNAWINQSNVPEFSVIGREIENVNLAQVNWDAKVEEEVSYFNLVRKDLAKDVKIPGFVFNPKAAANFIGELKCADIPPAHWAKELAEVWLRTNRYPVNVVNGKLECNLDKSLTRAQAALLVTAYQYPDVASEINNIQERLDTGIIKMPFADVPLDHKFAAWVYAANALGVMTGDNKLPRTFRPDETLNRVELLAIVQRSFGMGEAVEEIAEVGDEYDAFGDLDNNGWYRKNVDFSLRFGVMRGYADGSFKPGQGVSFAEAMKIVQVGSVLKNALENPDFYEEDLDRAGVLDIFREAIAEDYLRFSEEDVDSIEVVDEMLGDLLDELGDGLGKFKDLGLKDKFGNGKRDSGLGRGKDSVGDFMNDQFGGYGGFSVGKGAAASGGGAEYFIDGGNQGYQGGGLVYRDKYGNTVSVTYNEYGVANSVNIFNKDGEFMGSANGQAAVDFLGQDQSSRQYVLQSTDPGNRGRNENGSIAASPNQQQQQAQNDSDDDDSSSSGSEGNDDQNAGNGNNEQEPTCDNNVGDCGDDQIAEDCASNNVDDGCQDDQVAGNDNNVDPEGNCINQDGCEDNDSRAQAALAVLCAIAGSNCEPGLADMLMAAGWGAAGGGCDGRNDEDCSNGNRILGAIVVNGVLGARNCDGRNGQDCNDNGAFQPTAEMVRRTVCAVRNCGDGEDRRLPGGVPVGPGGLR